MGAGDHNLEHASLHAAHIIDKDAQALPYAVALGSNLLAGGHDTFYSFGLVEIEQPATDGVFTCEGAETNFADPVLELIVEVFMLGLTNAL